MSFVVLVSIITGTLIGAWFATGRVTAWLHRRAILDHPNHRSLHERPTPRGGGIGLLAALIPSWALLDWFMPSSPWSREAWPVLVGALTLAALSFRDDIKPLSAGLRFGGQAMIVAVLLAYLPGEARVFQGWLPLWLDRCVTFIGWLWFVNLFNFMDGIDGIVGVQTVAIGLGVSLIAGLSGWILPSLWGLALAAATLGFLVWNWHPARVFLGDVGSVPLGFLSGWLLLHLAIAGAWAAALILPGYFLADATLTLLRRLMRGEKIWQAHREHFYQRAVQSGHRHDWVSGWVAMANGLLLCCAWSADASPWLGLCLAITMIAVLLRFFVRPRSTV